MKTLLTGSQGQVGFELLSNWPRDRQVFATSTAELDLRDPDAIRQIIRDLKPNLIVNAAAYTAVDRAEEEPDQAYAINGKALEIIGEEAKRIGAAVVHFSTDYVFDGSKREPYLPTDSPNPQGVYGRSKLQGEQALASSGVPHLTFRTSWVYGLRGRNFLLAILRQAAAKPELRIVSDQYGSPTWCRIVALLTIKAIFNSMEIDRGMTHFGGREGIYHLTCGGVTNWFEFARKIIELAELDHPPILVPITAFEYGARAARPAYSVLDCTATADTFGVLIVDWASALEELLIGQRAHLPGIVSQ